MRRQRGKHWRNIGGTLEEDHKKKHKKQRKNIGENLRKMGLNERQIKAVKFVKEKGKITNMEYQELNKKSKPTATRVHHELVVQGLVIMHGEAKRQIYYQLSQ